MKVSAPGSFGAQLKALREAAGFTQEELATIAGLSIHAVSALERGERRRPHVETVRALSAALDLTGPARDALLKSARAPAHAVFADLRGAALPLTLTALLGREADMQTLGQWLADPILRLITLTGPGGAGKTRLALELARVSAEQGSTRVVFVPLVAIRDPTFVASAIAEALGLADVTAVGLLRRARIACGDQPTLLVLDNFEQVLNAAPLVVDLLTSVASLRVLATSRAPLRVRGEREFTVGALSFDVDAEAMAPADLARLPAVRLFLERVRDVKSDFRLTPANAPTVAAICRRLDALPLALELAAPWMKVLTVEDLLRRLDHDVLPPTPEARDLPERQHTMNATVAWSYQLLDSHEQHAFRRFGALPGAFSVEAAAAVLDGREGALAKVDDALRSAAGLIDKSLLGRAETSLTTRPLFQMLETVRAYAGLELTAAGDRDDAREGLARYCVAEASLAAGGLVGPAQAEWLDRVRDDVENYRSAMVWLIERGRPAEASDIASGLLFFWMIRGHTAEGLRWYEQILKLPLPPEAESRALFGAAAMQFTQGELEGARTAVTRALTIAQSVARTDLIAPAENLFGYVEHAAGNMDAARERFTRSVEGFRALATPWGTGNALNGLARVHLARGDAGLAEPLLHEATAILRQAGPWFLSLTLSVRANLAVRRGNAREAMVLLRESLTHIQDLHDKYAFAYTLVFLAAAAVLKGDDIWAARILAARDIVTERAGATVVDKTVQEVRDQVERDVRARLGSDRWDRAYSAGRMTSIDSLMKNIDNALRSGVSD
jgi:predicted ATPase/DNA-binding XRE family transcriptional regulator